MTQLVCSQLLQPNIYLPVFKLLAQIVSSKQSEVEGKQGEKIRLLKPKNTSHRIARKFGNCDSRGQHQIHVSVGHFDSVHVDRTSI